MRTEAQTAFVTGGSGFLGSHLIRALRTRGYGVRALARSDTAAKAVDGAGATAVRGDLGTVPDMAAGMRGCSVVFHSAARLETWGGYEDAYRDNVVGSDNVVAAARTAGVPRLVLVSAAAVVIGERPLIDVDETWPISSRPPGAYGQTKAIAERRVLAASSPDLTTVAVRPPGIWGLGDRMMLPGIVEAVRRKQFVWIAGGHYPYVLCHVRNVCEGALLAAERGTPGGVYFLTDGPPMEFRALITDLLATQGVAPPTTSLPRPVAVAFATLAEAVWRIGKLRGEPPITRTLLALIGGPVSISDRRARTELGYVGHVSREEGLAELARAAREAATAGVR